MQLIILIQIFEKETRIIAPFAFDSIIWKEGTYQLELHYSGGIANTQFTIENDGTIGIPYWIKDISKFKGAINSLPPVQLNEASI